MPTFKANQSDIDRASPAPDYSRPDAVHTYFGYAAYWAQLLELAMLNLVASIRLADQRQIDDVTYNTAFEKLDRHTLGMLLRKCREANWLTISEDDELLLQEALDKRNYLMHRFFSAHDDELLDDSHELVNELRELSALLAAARQTAESLYFAVLSALDDDDYTLTKRILRQGLAWENIVVKERQQDTRQSENMG